MAYVLTGGGITVRFEPATGTVTDETIGYKNTVTSYPVSSGTPVNDHIYSDSISFTIGGMVRDAATAERLEKLAQSRAIVEYQGQRRVKNLVITSLQPKSTAKNKGGYDFTLSLTQVRFVSSQKVQLAVTASSGSSTGTYASRTRNLLLEGLDTNVNNTGQQTTQQYDITKDPYLNPSLRAAMGM